MRNCEYRLNGRRNKGMTSKKGIMYGEEEAEFERHKKHLGSLGLADDTIVYVLENPRIFPILNNAISVVEGNPQLTLKEVVMELRRRRQKPEDYETSTVYSESLSIPGGVRTWKDFIPVDASKDEMKSVPFSGLPEEEKKVVDCQVCGIHRDGVPSSSHFYEHAFERDSR